MRPRHSHRFTDPGPRWQTAFAKGDAEHGNAVVGEAIGMIRDRPQAAQVIEGLAAEAEALAPPEETTSVSAE